MTRTIAMALIALLMVGTAHAELLVQDSIGYADDAAMRAVWKSDDTGASDTVWTVGAGLSFANHFASSGGSMTNGASYNMAVRDLETTVQISGAVGDNSWAGVQKTFYVSYLINTSDALGWGFNAATSLYRDGYYSGGNAALGSAVYMTDLSTNLQPGGRANTSGYAASVAGPTIAGETTHLVVAKYVLTNPTGSYNPWNNGTLDSSVVFLSESDAYPIDEASITWDITDSRAHSMGGPNVNMAWIGLLNQAMNSGDVRIDEFRVGTEFADVVNVPEPATMSLLAAGGLAILRRRRR